MPRRAIPLENQKGKDTMLNENYEPDTLEKGIRFGCGAFFGVFFAFLILLHGVFLENVFFRIVFFILLVLFFGFIAMKQGDRFWNSIKHCF